MTDCAELEERLVRILRYTHSEIGLDEDELAAIERYYTAKEYAVVVAVLRRALAIRFLEQQAQGPEFGLEQDLRDIDNMIG